jgi:poly(A) polymerase
MCATFNITHSNKAVIQRELERAGEIAEKIMTNALPWKDLFVKHTFFTKGYKYYLAVIVTSKEKEAHKIWSGFVESKVRVLVSTLERHPSIAIAHPFNKGFDRLHRVKNDEEFGAVLDGQLNYLIKEEEEDSSKENGENGEPKAVDSEQAATAGGENGAKPEGLPDIGSKIYTTTHYIGLELAEGMCALGFFRLLTEFSSHGFVPADSPIHVTRGPHFLSRGSPS